MNYVSVEAGSSQSEQHPESQHPGVCGRSPCETLVVAGPSRMDDVLNARAASVRRKFEVPILVAALAVVPVILLEERATSPALLSVAYWANWAIWAAFTAEYATILTLTDKRWAYTRRAWLDVFIITTSFPLLPTLLAGTRLFRLARLTVVLRMLRLARLGAVLTRGGAAAGVIFRKRGLGYIVMLTLLVALGVGGVFAIVEGSAMTDGFWWAIVTVTTVGYGDMFPVTAAGRAAATVLMLLGIGLVAVITAAVAAHFVEDDTDRTADELARLNDQMAALAARLDQLGFRAEEVSEQPFANEEGAASGR